MMAGSSHLMHCPTTIIPGLQRLVQQSHKESLAGLPLAPLPPLNLSSLPRLLSNTLISDVSFLSLCSIVRSASVPLSTLPRSSFLRAEARFVHLRAELKGLLLGPVSNGPITVGPFVIGGVDESVDS